MLKPYHFINGRVFLFSQLIENQYIANISIKISKIIENKLHKNLFISKKGRIFVLLFKQLFIYLHQKFKKCHKVFF